MFSNETVTSFWTAPFKPDELLADRSDDGADIVGLLGLLASVALPSASGIMRVNGSQIAMPVNRTAGAANGGELRPELGRVGTSWTTTTEVFCLIEMLLTISCSPHWIGVHNGYVVSLSDWYGCSDLKSNQSLAVDRHIKAEHYLLTCTLQFMSKCLLALLVQLCSIRLALRKIAWTGVAVTGTSWAFTNRIPQMCMISSSVNSVVCREKNCLSTLSIVIFSFSYLFIEKTREITSRSGS